MPGTTTPIANCEVIDLAAERHKREQPEDQSLVRAAESFRAMSDQARALYADMKSAQRRIDKLLRG